MNIMPIAAANNNPAGSFIPLATSRYEANIPNDIAMMTINSECSFFFNKFMTYLWSGGPFTGTLDAARVPVKCDDFSTFTPKYDVLSMFIVRLRQGECFR